MLEKNNIMSSANLVSRNQSVRLVTVSNEESGQRLDNFLLRLLSGVPKSRVYKAMRKGEVRLNKGRAKPDSRLKEGDVVRVPPFREVNKTLPVISHRWIDRIHRSIVFDENDLLIINKPTGLAVHGGSGINAGLIEILRAMYPAQRYMELVHRLDRDTSGLIMVARRASVLRELHELLRRNSIEKRYQCLVYGRWPAHLKQVDASLEKFMLGSGERRVRVSGGGKASLTQFRVLKRWKEATLVEAKPVTGRTHQIRVHCHHVGHPILGDNKYEIAKSAILSNWIGLNRLFLHAVLLRFELGGECFVFESPIDHELNVFYRQLTSML